MGHESDPLGKTWQCLKRLNAQLIYNPGHSKILDLRTARPVFMQRFVREYEELLHV